MLGLPNGNGWLNEPKWFIYIYKLFEKSFDSVKHSIEKEALKGK